MTKKQMEIAKQRHARGERWYDGPELLIPELDGMMLGIGTREELDAMKADGILDQAVTYRPATPEDVA